MAAVVSTGPRNLGWRAAAALTVTLTLAVQGLLPLMATIVASGVQYLWVGGRRATRHYAGRNPSTER